jgi:hypothetical protein
MGEKERASDEVLVRRTQAGDSQAFGSLVGRYMRASYAVGLSVTGRHEDAEDAAQEGFIVALERLDDCRAPDRFAGWLMTIVRNRARNLVRREVLRDTDAGPGRTPRAAGNCARTASGGPKRDRASSRSRGLAPSRDRGAPRNPFGDRSIASPLRQKVLAAGRGPGTGRNRARVPRASSHRGGTACWATARSRQRAGRE